MGKCNNTRIDKLVRKAGKLEPIKSSLVRSSEPITLDFKPKERTLKKSEIILECTKKTHKNCKL